MTRTFLELHQGGPKASLFFDFEVGPLRGEREQPFLG